MLLTVLAVSSCDSYLDEVPDNRQDIKTLENIQEILVTAYAEGSYNFIEWMSDNVTAIPDNTQVAWLTENYQFEPVVSSEQQDTPTNFWSESYYAIAHANQALEAIDLVEDTDTNYKNALRGEALITRAYNHFMLVNIFAQHYSAENAGTLGVPYLTAPETELQVNYERGTVQETYDLIEKDLLEALPLISDEYFTGSTKYHFNKNAAYAFASRFFLFKGDYTKCIEYSNKMLGGGVIGTNFVRNMEEVFTGSNPTQIANQFGDVFATSNLLVVRKETAYVDRYYQGYQTNAAVRNGIYRNNIQRSSDERDLMYGYSSGAIAPPKYDELFRYTTATSGFPYFIMIELRSEEVVLNRMEAYVRQNMLDEALDDYNVMAPLRYANGGQLTLAEIKAFYEGTEQEAMLEFVISERRKEFVREGLRWFDIKRLNLEVTHIDVNDNEFKVGETDLKKAVQIPANAIALGIEANPR